jgi:hypothetical protein
MVTDATLDHLERDEALDIGAELGEIFSLCAGAVLVQRTIDNALRQGWIECPARTVSHEDERGPTCAVVALENLSTRRSRSGSSVISEVASSCEINGSRTIHPSE